MDDALKNKEGLWAQHSWTVLHSADLIAFIPQKLPI